jgi:hypothetical protein
MRTSPNSISHLQDLAVHMSNATTKLGLGNPPKRDVHLLGHWSTIELGLVKQPTEWSKDRVVSTWKRVSRFSITCKEATREQRVTAHGEP